ncbi:MAG: hypothetical protein ABEL76_05880 [Bradymonadaceae bacterium]
MGTEQTGRSGTRTRRARGVSGAVTARAASDHRAGEHVVLKLSLIHLERTAELLRDLGSQRRLADVLEHELAEHCGADTEREIALRRELADVYAELDWPEQAFDHLDRLIEVDPDGETVEDFVEAAEEAERESEALERLEELRERTEDGDGELYESVLAKLE